jgi:hypothetical protein
MISQQNFAASSRRMENLIGVTALKYLKTHPAKGASTNQIL